MSKRGTHNEENILGCPLMVCRQYDIVVDEGIPFTVLRNARRSCLCCCRIPREAKDPESSQATGAPESAPPPPKRWTPGTKCVCPALMRIKQVEMYPAYKVNRQKCSTGRQLEIVSRRLMASLKRALEEDSEGLLRQERFYISMSDINSHCSHDTSLCGKLSVHVEPEVDNSDTSECGSPSEHDEPEVAKCDTSQCGRPRGDVQPQVAKKIVELVHRGMTSVKEMETYLKNYVRDNIILNRNAQLRSRSKYYITSKELQRRVWQALRECKFNSTDQENVAKYVEELREKTPTLNCFFRACEVKHQEDNQPLQDQTVHILESLAQECQETLLFCIQTDFMKELLLKYSSDVLSLVATYKTTECVLPLFFIMVKTPSCYAVVGAFVVQFETAECIGEALSVWRAWNPDVNPRFWIVDCNEAEVAAISNAFPCGRTIFSDYQRKQAWHEWLSRKENGVADVFHVKDLLGRIADSQNEEEFKMAISRLDQSHYYLQNEKLQKYIIHWLSIKEKWVKLYRDLPVDSYNGAELRLYLTKNCGQPSLLKLVKALAEKCFTEMRAQFFWASTSPLD
uniref:Zinc finger mym domain protein n=1 Tax=Rhipicephalus appendiculatus TaxID=34631 RepID=A0A131YAV3_RHIAP